MEKLIWFIIGIILGVLGFKHRDKIKSNAIKYGNIAKDKAEQFKADMDKAKKSN
jgi:hypothetical protein